MIVSASGEQSQLLLECLNPLVAAEQARSQDEVGLTANTVWMRGCQKFSARHTGFFKQPLRRFRMPLPPQRHGSRLSQCCKFFTAKANIRANLRDERLQHVVRFG